MMKVKCLALRLTDGGRLVIMGSLHLPPLPHKPRGSLTTPTPRVSPGPEACNAAAGFHKPGASRTVIPAWSQRWRFRPRAAGLAARPGWICPCPWPRESPQEAKSVADPGAQGPKKVLVQPPPLPFWRHLRLRGSGWPLDNRQCACADLGFSREGEKGGGNCGTEVPKLERLRTWLPSTSWCQSFNSQLSYVGDDSPI